jgi:hypothetical protein
MKPILTVLIPSIPRDEKLLKTLLSELHFQQSNLFYNHPTLSGVEIIYDDSKAFLDGGLSIGKKRDKLVQKAHGMYLCFCDVDDFPAPNYLETLVRMCYEKKDVVTFRNFTTNDFFWTIVDMSLSHPADEEATPERIVKRRPWPICPVRTEYAQRFPFPDTNYSEDAVWMKQVLTLCKTEVHTDKILHTYKHSARTSEADNITRHEATFSKP